MVADLERSSRERGWSHRERRLLRAESVPGATDLGITKMEVHRRCGRKQPAAQVGQRPRWVAMGRVYAAPVLPLF